MATKKMEFRIAGNTERPGSQLVEILLDGKFCAAIYPQPDGTLKLVSAHFAGEIAQNGFPAGITMDDGSTSFPPIPSLNVRFDPAPYVIQGNRLVKVPK